MPPLSTFDKSCLVLAIAQTFSLQTAQATTIEVDSFSDDNGAGCTLREAIANTNAGDPGISNGCTIVGTLGDNDTVNFDPNLTGDTFELNSVYGELSITKDVVINGLNITIDANKASRVMDITNSTVSLNSLTIANGSTINRGGGILANSSSVSLSNSTVSGNSASEGGGIYAVSSSVSLSNSTVSGSSADTNGGGIYAYITSVSLSNSTVSGNSASARGGGIYATNISSISLSNSTVSGNSANTYGGGIQARNAIVVSLSNSTVSGNLANIRGGGINARNTSVSLSNSTVSGNLANTHGGGFFAHISSVSLVNSIIAGNFAPQGAEIHNSNVLGLSTFTTDRNVLGDSNYTNAEAFDGFTLSGANITATRDGTQATALSSILEPLANTGGPTQTHALVSGSPAINAANVAACPPVDQRGEQRDIGGLFLPIVTSNNKIAVISLDGECDIGSFEEQ